jgi:hypothetical protein
VQVAELEGLFGGLRADVEALFMQAPSSDLHSLYERAQRERLVLDEQVCSFYRLAGRACEDTLRGGCAHALIACHACCFWDTDSCSDAAA